MKKITSFTVAFGLMASLGTAAFADSAQATTSTTTTLVAPIMNEPIIKADSGVVSNTIPLILTKVTNFYFEPNGKVINAMAPQVVATTGNRVSGIVGEWVEIYTWLGIAWVHVD